MGLGGGYSRSGPLAPPPANLAYSAQIEEVVETWFHLAGLAPRSPWWTWTPYSSVSCVKLSVDRQV